MAPTGFDAPNSSENFFRLSQISKGIADSVRQTFGERTYWIVAEISDLAVRKGHCYISLVEKLSGAAAPICELKGIIWSSEFPSISTKFKTESGIELSKGIVILFRAFIKYDVKWGLSLSILEIDSRFTIGQIQLERDRAVAALKQEGVHDKNRSLPFPLVAQRLAVISASDSRGYEDFMQKLNGNPYGYVFHCQLFQSLLQGDKAAQQMVDQLITIFNRLQDFDAVVIVRGGGGAVDLNCFNDLRLARAIARFPLPVITGIGHSTNRSVSDEVAHADRITPTDAADYFIERTLAYENQLTLLLRTIAITSEDMLLEETNKVESLVSDLANSFDSLVSDESSYLDDTALLIRDKTLSLLNSATYKIATSGVKLGQLSKGLVSREQERLKRNLQSIQSHPIRNIKTAASILDGLENTVRHLDPINVLKRGFSITLKDGKAVTNSNQLTSGDTITTILHEGKIESRI